MALSLGIKLVILLPSLLFLIGFSFKSVIEKNSIKKLLASKSSRRLFLNLREEDIDSIIPSLRLEEEYRQEKGATEIFVPLITKISSELWLDFLFLLSFDAIFLIVANGLIIMFELQQTEIGIISIIIGLIFSLCMLIAAHINAPMVGRIGIIGVFAIIGWEFGYFLSFDLEKMIWIIPIDSILPLVTTISSVVIGYKIIEYSIPLIETCEGWWVRA